MTWPMRIASSSWFRERVIGYRSGRIRQLPRDPLKLAKQLEIVPYDEFRCVPPAARGRACGAYSAATVLPVPVAMQRTHRASVATT